MRSEFHKRIGQLHRGRFSVMVPCNLQILVVVHRLDISVGQSQLSIPKTSAPAEAEAARPVILGFTGRAQPMH